jgi:hypothetical protein
VPPVRPALALVPPVGVTTPPDPPRLEVLTTVVWPPD